MIKKLQSLILTFAAVASLAAVPAYAAPATQSSGNSCGGTKTQLIACDGKNGIEAIGGLIKLAVTVLTVLIGTVAVGGLAYAAILYAGARDNQNQVSSAITIIRNIVIGLIMYGFTIAIINWLVPGGVIG